MKTSLGLAEAAHLALERVLEAESFPIAVRPDGLWLCDRWQWIAVEFKRDRNCWRICLGSAALPPLPAIIACARRGTQL